MVFLFPLADGDDIFENIAEIFSRTSVERAGSQRRLELDEGGGIEVGRCSRQRAVASGSDGGREAFVRAENGGFGRGERFADQDLLENKDGCGRSDFGL